MDNILSLQMLSTAYEEEQVCGQSNVSCPSNASCLSQTSTPKASGIGGGDSW